MLGEERTEQFMIETRVDGKVIKTQAIHDPFIFSKTVVGVSRWGLFKAMFRRQFEIKVEVAVQGTEGMIRAIMMLDPEQIKAETTAILEDRKRSRENGSTDNCFTVEA